MNVLELHSLAKWYQGYFNRLNSLYTQLYQVLEHNATQQNQQPVEPKLEALIPFLQEMDLGELSLQQIQLLESLEVRELIGPDGAHFVDQAVRTSKYDPASSQGRIKDARQKLSSANDRLGAYIKAVAGLGISEAELEAVEKDRITIRVGFKNEAAIDNVIHLKDAARDWFDIVRGVAMAVGEAPETTRVIGATSGSIILILSGSVAFTKALALISKHITQIAKDVLSVAAAREDLRQKKLLTKAMETEFKSLEAQKRMEGLEELHKQLSAIVDGKQAGDVSTAVEKSVEKLLKFGEKGGDVDFVVPPAHEDEGEEEGALEDAGGEALRGLEEVRDMILSYQRTREDVRLLEDGRGDADAESEQ